jgi:hypothetical protein
MIYDSMEARDEILARLRRALSGPRPIFRERSDSSAPPGTPTAVTQADGDRRSLAKQFGAKLEEVSGGYEILESRTLGACWKNPASLSSSPRTFTTSAPVPERPGRS